MSRHNFTIGTTQNKTQVPLTLELIAESAPSALATRPYAAWAETQQLVVGA